MPFYDAIRVGASGAVDFEVERSLRFNSADATILQRTLSSSGNRRTFTWSGWVKRAKPSSSSMEALFASTTEVSSGNSNTYMTFYQDKIYINSYNYPSGSAYTLTTNQVFRDPSAWYHIVWAVDTTQSTSSNRIKLYVNGEQVTSFSTASYPSQNYEGLINSSSYKMTMGRAFPSLTNNSPLNGYIAEATFIDGLQLTPASFGETNAATGQWVPIDTSGLTFGTNGFRLKFADNSGTSATTLGKDSSGNGNNFTPNNFSVSAGAGNDSLEDTPTNNFCTLNPLDKMGTVTLSEGNLKVVINGDNASLITGSFGVSSGKWYYEAVADTAGAGFVGWIRKDVSSYTSYPYQQGGSLLYFSQNGSRYKDGDGGASYGASYGNGDIIGCAINLDDNEVTWYKNNASQGTISINAGTYNPNATTGGSSATFTFNFGQRAFSYTPPTGFNALNSANLPDPTILLPNKHFDILLYTGNGGTNTISGLNYSPDWVWGKTRNTDAVHYMFDQVRGPNKYLDTQTDQETTNQTDLLTAFTSDGFTLGANAGSKQVNKNGNTYVAWNWDAGETDSATYTVKVVSDSGNKYRFNDFGTSAVTLDLAEGGTYTFDGSDSSMSSHPFVIGTAANGSVYSTGVTYQLDGASVTYSAYTSGYSTATTRKLIITVPASAPVLYYWCSVHSGMGGQINTNSTLGSSNFDGTIQTTVKASPTAGFSIITYTGNGTNNATIGHGLGVAPVARIGKGRNIGTVGSAGSHWSVNHQNLNNGMNGGSNAGTVFLSTDQAPENNNHGAVGAVSSTTMTLSDGSSGSVPRAHVNENNYNYLQYAFSEIEGYSRFGKYTGNGSTDGPFVFLGFRPALLIIRNASSTGDFIMLDNKRNTFNYVNRRLKGDTNSAEDANYNVVSFLSNGFKVENQYDGSWNGNGNTFIYFAWAESPFKNSRAR